MTPRWWKMQCGVISGLANKYLNGLNINDFNGSLASLFPPSLLKFLLKLSPRQPRGGVRNIPRTSKRERCPLLPVRPSPKGRVNQFNQFNPGSLLTL